MVVENVGERVEVVVGVGRLVLDWIRSLARSAADGRNESGGWYKREHKSRSLALEPFDDKSEVVDGDDDDDTQRETGDERRKETTAAGED